MTRLRKKAKSLDNALKAIDEFRRALVLKDGKKIQAIMLYGSVANGRYCPHKSDIDIMVVAKNKSIDEDILSLETKISLKYGVVISALSTTLKEFEEGKRAGYSFFDEVLKGKVLYERPNTRNKTGL